MKCAVAIAIAVTAFMVFATSNANAQSSESTCLEEFGRSQAAETCIPTLGEPMRWAPEKCRLRGICQIDGPGNWQGYYKEVPKNRVRDLRNCGGKLKLGVC